MSRSLITLLLTLFYFSQAQAIDRLPTVDLPSVGLTPEQLAVLVNERDPISLQVAEYYQQSRGIPPENIIKLRFDPAEVSMSPGQFAVLQRLVEKRLPRGIQAFALAWAQPYRVDCMSITSAFAFGYDRRFCSDSCGLTEPSLYFKHPVDKPFDKLGLRPTMMLAADNLKNAEVLIDRGIVADGSWPRAAGALLVETPDKARSVRKVSFPEVEARFGNWLRVERVQGRDVQGRDGLMFYFTGDLFVQGIDQNTWLPGGVGDHLTSHGGKLTDSSQMSALAWLEGGATASYGTVVEPCNHLQKFPNPPVFIEHYLKGWTLIEAYWASVSMPGEGVFIGEPLASPFRAYRFERPDEHLRLYSPQLAPGRYRLHVSDCEGCIETALMPAQRIREWGEPLMLSIPIRGHYRIEALNH